MRVGALHDGAEGVGLGVFCRCSRLGSVLRSRVLRTAELLEARKAEPVVEVRAVIGLQGVELRGHRARQEADVVCDRVALEEGGYFRVLRGQTADGQKTGDVGRGGGAVGRGRQVDGLQGNADLVLLVVGDLEAREARARPQLARAAGPGRGRGARAVRDGGDVAVGGLVLGDVLPGAICAGGGRAK